MKDKKGVTIVNSFQSILKNSMKLHSNKKTNKIWVDKGTGFYNNSFKKSLQDNDTKIYSTHDEGKSVVAKRFNRTLNKKNYKYITSTSNSVYIDKLYDIVNKYKDTYHITIKIKPVMLKIIHILILIKKLIISILNLKLLIM